MISFCFPAFSKELHNILKAFSISDFKFKNFRPGGSEILFGCFAFNAVDDIVRNL